MNSTALKRQFRQVRVLMGFSPPPPPRLRWSAERQGYALDVQRDENGERLLAALKAAFDAGSAL